MVYVGLQGAMFEESKRKQIPLLVKLDASAFLIQIGFNIYATYIYYHERPVCYSATGDIEDPRSLVAGAVYSTWAVVLSILMLILILYNIYPHYSDSKSWERHFKCLGWMCCCSQEMAQSYGTDARPQAERLGRIFALTFGAVDLTLSDILCSFYLAMTYHRLERKGLASSKSQRRFNNLESMEGGGHGGYLAHSLTSDSLSVDALTLKQASHYMNYAFASYGWLLYVWGSPATGCFDLCCGRRCSMCVTVCRPRERSGGGTFPRLTPIVRDAAIREVIVRASHLKSNDILFVRQERQVLGVLPYFVGVDRIAKEVILSVRGSLSLEDVVRDLIFEPADLTEWLHPTQATAMRVPPEVKFAPPDARHAAHAGILDAARATLLDIQNNINLEEMLLVPDAPYKGYRLIVTGHSLGAGCAFLMCLYLRHFFPNLTCWAFSPPGGLVTSELAKSAGDWCTSVVCGKEWIPRLTYSTFDRMRSEMVFAGLRCKLPKAVVLSAWLVGKRWKEDDLFHPPSRLTNELEQVLEKYEGSLHRAASEASAYEAAKHFAPPGKLLYLAPTGKEDRKSRYGGLKDDYRQFRAVWTTCDDLLKDGILLSSRMMADHMPDYAVQVLKQLAVAAEKGENTTSVSDLAGNQAVEDAMQSENHCNGSAERL